ncbi:hypothetical protein [Taibaiella soli]|uniref:Uncharacterized protein n=1 Tax=Taibaiella soli TaxID=1649169 RepID=A0A2W2ACM5_9BACT|nr:hypothetical protein [Taibaiella soli]PZF71372.1 hypothetical protein DN068_18960 [Taibaiella soli]
MKLSKKASIGLLVLAVGVAGAAVYKSTHKSKTNGGSIGGFAWMGKFRGHAKGGHVGNGKLADRMGDEGGHAGSAGGLTGDGGHGTSGGGSPLA